jgi:dephospho-CoA kinase
VRLPRRLTKTSLSAPPGNARHASGRLQSGAMRRPRSPAYSLIRGLPASLLGWLFARQKQGSTTGRGTRRRKRPLAVAITGGIGAGKSEALEAFRRHGAAVLSSDEVVHRLLREDEDVKRAVVERLGERVLDSDGEIDRERVGELVFADPLELDWLERLLHPRVSAEYLRWRDELGRLPDPPAVCATEVPLLYEVGAEKSFDAVVVVTASPEVRVTRHIRPMHDRERRLLSDEEKATRADFVYVNDGSLEDLDAFVSEVTAKLSTS